MKKSLVVAFPILEGKTVTWKEFMYELNGPRFRSYQESRRDSGVSEKIFFQHTSKGDMAIWVLEGEDPRKGIDYFSTNNNPFTLYFIKMVKEIHGVDLSAYNATSMGEVYVDSEIKSVTTH